MAVILATWEAEISRITFGGQHWQKSLQNHISTNRKQDAVARFPDIPAMWEA
jgi:hypothetical protein